jgi:hypothetical protein
MNAGRNTKSFYPLLAASIAIGAIDNSAFFVYQVGLLTDTGVHLMMGALLSWMVLFFFAVGLLRVRSLWLLLTLPLVFLPLALAVIGAGQI